MPKLAFLGVFSGLLPHFGHFELPRPRVLELIDYSTIYMALNGLLGPSTEEGVLRRAATRDDDRMRVRFMGGD